MDQVGAERLPGSPAAQYLRMSSDPQRLSIPMQIEANRRFAEAHGYLVVKTYIDPGLTGLTIKDRLGLQSLLSDVMAGGCGFEAILVHDVSRWGRFQDPDEAGHYEFMCRSAGISVQYTTEAFINDGSLEASIMKQIKRIGAAGWSRDHGAKIRQVHEYLHAHGLHRGGPSPYAYERHQVSASGEPEHILGPGEQKSFATSRSVLVPGPPDEIRVVQRIFREFASRRRGPVQIAAGLNADGLRTRRGHCWTSDKVRGMLQNELYVGTAVLGKERFDLGKRSPRLPKAEWRRRPRAIPAIVSRATWTKAAALLDFRRRRVVSEDRLLKDLRALQSKRRFLTARIIDDAGGPPASRYRRCFGSLAEAYRRAGFGETEHQQRLLLRAPRSPKRCRRRASASDDDVLRGLRAVLLREGRLTHVIVEAACECPPTQDYRQRFGGMRLAYALVGYQPNSYQELKLAAQCQSVSVDQARAICAVVNALAPGASTVKTSNLHV